MTGSFTLGMRAATFRAAATIVACFALLSCVSGPAPAREDKTPPGSQTKFDSLIAAGDSEGIRKFFADKSLLDTADKDGLYPLHKAVIQGSVPILELLLDLGASIESRDPEGRSALRLAADLDSIPCVRVLAEKKADLFSVDAKGRSVADVVLAKGGDMIGAAFGASTVNARGLDGKTALHLACDRLLEDAAGRLLASGADASIKDASGQNPLDLALLHPDRIEAARIAELLIKKGASSSFPDFAWFAAAARLPDYASIRYTDGGTPLHQAAMRRQKGFLEFLIERRAAVNAADASGATALHLAARQSWTEGLSPLLRAGADPNQADRGGNRALQAAVQAGASPETARLLIAAGAQVDARNALGDTALVIAQRLDRLDLASLLIGAGANILAANARGESPLSVALAKGQDSLAVIITPSTLGMRDEEGNQTLAAATLSKARPEAIAFLASRGAAVNARNNSGEAALHLAVRRSLRQQGEALILAGADIFLKNKSGESPVSIAFASPGLSEDWLFNTQSMAARDEAGDSPLHYAARLDRPEAVDLLMRRGADILAANKAGERPLHAAARADATKAAAALIRHLGALAEGGIEARDSSGGSALHTAVSWTARGVIPLLVDARANPNARDRSAETPLHKALRKRDRETLQYLLHKEANIDALDNDDTSPLSAAVRSGYYEIVFDLTAAGAKLESRDLEGRTPLFYAAQSMNTQICRLLAEAGADILARDAAGASALSLALAAPRELLSAILVPVNINRADPEGRTPLAAALESKPEARIVEFFVTAGADLGARDRRSQTALHLALLSGQIETAALLARAGADPFARDREGRSPVSIAMALSEAALRALVEGAGIGARDRLGSGWLHYAVEANDKKALRLFLDAGAEAGARNIAGQSAADLAALRGRPELVLMLK